MQGGVVTVKTPAGHGAATPRSPAATGARGGADAALTARWLPLRSREIRRASAAVRSYTAPAALTKEKGMPRHVDYALARRAVLRDLRRGVISRRDVCDAHPELVRAGRNVGEHAPHECPVCDRGRVRFVSYVYGEALKQANGCAITNAAELDRLNAAFDEFACYVVEVCLDCGWNHLDRRYLLGRRHAGPSRPSRREDRDERLHGSRAGLSRG